MKILRAIGHFFAKIGRWIANTAWVQPLLIVGGIFAIIFSIPYIKKGFENAFADNTDAEYEWYKNHALALEEGARADKLLGYLENFEDDSTCAQKIKNEFGSKFILTFVKQSCQNCKEAVAGYEYAVSSGWAEGFKLYCILVDQLDSEGKEYIAKDIYQKHNELFDQIAEYYGEGMDEDEYSLYRNLNAKDKHSQTLGLKEKSEGLPEATTSDEGLDTPLTLMIDVDNAGSTLYGTNGISHVIYNYIDFDFSNESNAATKGMVIRDFWNNQGLFDPETQE